DVGRAERVAERAAEGDAAHRADQAADLAGRAGPERVVVVRAAGRVDLDPLEDLAARDRDDRELTERLERVVRAERGRVRVAGGVAGRGQRVGLLAAALEPVVAADGERDVAVVRQVHQLAARGEQRAVLLVEARLGAGERQVVDRALRGPVRGQDVQR